MDDPSQDQMAIAALFAALVETLDEQNEGFAQSFLRRLEQKHARLKQSHADPGKALDPLAWTRALLREDLDRAEPASVVYAKVWNAEEDRLPASDKIQLPTLDEALRFWLRLPTYDRERATIETASGHRMDLAQITSLAARYKDVLSK